MYYNEKIYNNAEGGNKNGKMFKAITTLLFTGHVNTKKK